MLIRPVELRDCFVPRNGKFILIIINRNESPLLDWRRKHHLSGVTIGNRCVIGAGFVVTKNIPYNSLPVGNLTRLIRKS